MAEKTERKEEKRRGKNTEEKETSIIIFHNVEAILPIWKIQKKN